MRRPGAAVAENATPRGLEPARTVIRRLGGPTVIAAALGLHRTRVSAWQRAAAAGGTDGRIPQKHFAGLLGLAELRKVQLAPRELVQVVRARKPGRRFA